MEITNLIPHIEALVFASEKPLTSLELTELINNAFGFLDDKITLDQIEAGLEGIVEKYNSEFYPFEVKQSGGGWQFLTKVDFHKTIAQLNGDKFMKRLSAAALETLAIIAYKQPVTKGEMEAIRGVSCDYAVQKLLEKELIVITGRNEKLPGHPLVYSTSKNFMDYFGINSADDLPKIKEVLAEQLVEPTLIRHDEQEIAATEETAAPAADEAGTEETGATEITDNGQLLVGENGELIENTETETPATDEPAEPDEEETGETGASDEPGDADEDENEKEKGDDEA